MLTLHALRDLHLDPQTHPRGQAHLSAASGLVRLGDRLYVIADDEHHLGVFSTAPHEPGRLVRLFEGDLPQSAKQRKALKPDMEALALLPTFAGYPDGALLALGSGSRANRNEGVLIALDALGNLHGRARHLSLDVLYEPLRAHFDRLNIEGAFVAGDELLLLQRGNKGDRRSACVRFAWPAVVDWLSAAVDAAPQPIAIAHHDLGDIDGIPLAFTDGAALRDGAWIFSAVAEDTDDAYEDGACRGAAVGVIDAGGALRSPQVLPQPLKVEGISVQQQASELVLTLVTDADDPAQPSQMWTARLADPT